MQPQLQGVLGFFAVGLLPTSSRPVGEGVSEMKLAPSDDPGPQHMDSATRFQRWNVCLLRGETFLEDSL